MRNSVLQPPNAHFLSEDVIYNAFLIRDKRNRSDTSGFTYGDCVSNDGVDKLNARPPIQLLDGKVTGGVQRIGQANLYVTSENSAPTSQMKDKWKRVKIAGRAQTNCVTGSSTKVPNRAKTCAIIAKFVELGGCITPKQLRAAQRRYVKKPEDLMLLLDKYVRDLYAKIEALERQRQSVLSSVAFSVTDVWSTAVEYFRLVRFGLRHTDTLLGFVREAMTPDVVFNVEYGPDAILQYRCLTNLFGDVNVETLRTIFSHLHTTDNSAYNCKQAKQLLNKRLVMHGSTYFDWNNSTRRVTRVLSQSDMLTPILRLIGNLEDASMVFEKVFEKALISPEFWWRQIMN